MPLSRAQRGWLYATGALLLITGVGWLIARYFFPSHGLFGEQPNWSEPWWLRAHGAALIGFLIVFGTVLPGHVGRGWRQRVNHSTGLINVAAVMVLAVTGYGLYYIDNGSWYQWFGTVHWVVGLAASGVLAVHIWRGRRRAQQRAHQRARGAGLPAGPAP